MSLLNLDPNPWSDGVERVHAWLFEVGGRRLTESTVIVLDRKAKPHVSSPFAEHFFVDDVLLPCPWGDACVGFSDLPRHDGRVCAYLENAEIDAAPLVSWTVDA